tara:strand:- start:14 stop:802 length:789 start_codon:yes stop_codon:yes gene_type:complete
MANDIEKQLLDELKRFNQIKHNSENLNEQNMATNNGSGFLKDQGASDLLKKFNNRQREMSEQEAEEEIEIPADPEAEEEELAIGDETEMDMGDETPIEDEGGEVDMEDEMGGEIDAEVEDTTELDVTDLVSKQDEVNAEMSDQKDILSKNTKSLEDLMSKLSDLETHLSSMDDMVSKIDSSETKIDEYRPKTEEEKLGLRKHDSGPYNKTLSDFFTDKEDVFDKTGKKQYILTPEEVDNYNEVDIEKSFSDPDEEEENNFQN